MNIHEYQAKDLLTEYGIPSPKGFAAFNLAEAEKAAAALPGPVRVVKAQSRAKHVGPVRGLVVAAASPDPGGSRSVPQPRRPAHPRRDSEVGRDR